MKVLDHVMHVMALCTVYYSLCKIQQLPETAFVRMRIKSDRLRWGEQWTERTGWTRETSC